MTTQTPSLEAEYKANDTESDDSLYLMFHVGEELYGLKILQVQEIAGMMHITRVPNASPCVKGIVNLRGRIVPVIEVRTRFGMPEQEYTELTSIIIVSTKLNGREISAGIIVDAVSEVARIGSDQIEPPPEIGQGADTELVLAVGKLDEKIIQILDINATLLQGHFSGNEEDN